MVFKLLSMPTKQSAPTAVVAWGVFPVCDCSRTVIQGRFRTPMIRGRPHPGLDQFGKVERLLSDDLDNWLCNLYFQLDKLPHRESGIPEISTSNVTHEEAPLDQTTPTCSSSYLPDKSPAGMFPTLEPLSEISKPGTPIKVPLTCSSDQPGKQKQPVGKISRPGAWTREEESRPSPCAEHLQQFSSSTQSGEAAPCRSSVDCCGLAQRFCVVWRLLPAELGLSCGTGPSVGQLVQFIILIFLTWFPRLYLHYCSQWLYLQARNVPVNRFRFHAHTVDLVYQSSLLRTLEELLLVLLGPLTLNAAMCLLLLIRWLCQLTFGSTPPFLSKLIMAVGAWTVLDPLAVFTVDAVLGRLSHSAEEPVADAAKLYWHFHRTEQSGTAGIIITLFLYVVLFILSFTLLLVYFLRLHNDGRMLDVFQRLHSSEGAYFIPDDLEVSNQELSYIVKKAEQWRGFSGERRKVEVYDYIWTQETSGGPEPPGTASTSAGETSTHVSIYTLYLSGLRQRYRHFLRQPGGAIIELIGDLDGSEAQVGGSGTGNERQEEKLKSSTDLRERKSKKPGMRSTRVGPVGGTDSEQGTTQKSKSHYK